MGIRTIVEYDRCPVLSCTEIVQSHWNDSGTHFIHLSAAAPCTLVCSQRDDSTAAPGVVFTVNLYKEHASSIPSLRLATPLRGDQDLIHQYHFDKPLGKNKTSFVYRLTSPDDEPFRATLKLRSTRHAVLSLKTVCSPNPR